MPIYKKDAVICIEGLAKGEDVSCLDCIEDYRDELELLDGYTFLYVLAGCAEKYPQDVIEVHGDEYVIICDMCGKLLWPQTIGRIKAIEIREEKSSNSS